MVVRVIIGAIGYEILSILTTIILIYLDRKKGTDPEYIYDEGFIEYFGTGLFWFITIPVLIFANIRNFIKTICVFIVETKIALETDEEEQQEEAEHIVKSKRRKDS